MCALAGGRELLGAELEVLKRILCLIGCLIPGCICNVTSFVKFLWLSLLHHGRL